MIEIRNRIVLAILLLETMSTIVRAEEAVEFGDANLKLALETRIWDAELGKETKSFPEQHGGDISVVFTTDGEKFTLNGGGGNIQEQEFSPPRNLIRAGVGDIVIVVYLGFICFVWICRLKGGGGTGGGFGGGCGGGGGGCGGGCGGCGG